MLMKMSLGIFFQHKSLFPLQGTFYVYLLRGSLYPRTSLKCNMTNTDTTDLRPLSFSAD
ncbi:hypothetical protein PDJAM_G00007070 [Pangasius djambal]|uniref:Uncharacterized protein n=1 Tax=Pangasius djambal TaxID=1691987 RepID=A0ACC5Y0H4_9TELE|nr:hypothetical protein [Pangasius djambal]